MFNATVVELINPDLIREYYQKPNDTFYEKFQMGMKRFEPLIGKDSLIFAEGETWKNRRKAFS